MTTFYCLRFETPQPGGPGPHIYIPQEQGVPLGSLFITSYDSQGYIGGIQPSLHMGVGYTYTDGVGSRYQPTTGDDTANWEDLMHAVVNCKECEIANALKSLIVTSFKSSVIPITNPIPIYSHSYM
jgi:hypothetical protein